MPSPFTWNTHTLQLQIYLFLLNNTTSSAVLVHVAGTHGCIFPLEKDMLGKRQGRTLIPLALGTARSGEGEGGQPEQGSLHPQAESSGWGRSTYPVK